MKFNKLFARLAAFVLIAILLLPTVVSADSIFTPYKSYEYNSDDKSVSAPIGYYLDEIVNNNILGFSFKNPSDMKVDSKGNIWVLDSGNSRIVVLDTNWNVVKIVSSIVDTTTNEVLEFPEATGLTVDSNENIYIADNGNRRIIVTDGNGIFKFIITKPETELLDDEIQCNFSKVLVDNYGRIYATADDVNNGAMVFTSEGKFVTFYGSNPIVKTMEVIKKFLTRKFMSEAQLKSSLQYTSSNFSNFDISNGDFIYTVTKDTDNSSVTAGLVRKLNVLNKDILSTEDNAEDSIFGDVEFNTEYGTPGGTKLIDIEVDSEDFMFLLDQTRGRVFLYSQQDNIMMTAFGGLGEQKGLFVDPVALESINDMVLVLDREDNCINVFKPTEYMTTFRAGVLQLNSGNYDGAYELFNKILSYNTNNETAYSGIGRALDEQGKYEEAMEYFKKAYNQNDYSESFEQYRKALIRQNFIPIILGAVLIFVLIVFLSSKINKKLAVKEGQAFSGWETKPLFQFYTMKHPADGFAQFRVRNIMSWKNSFIILVLWFLISVANYFWMGFPFNANRPENYRLIYTVLQTFGLFILFVVANYAICTLLEGKGKFKEIFAGVAYSLVPMLICQVIGLIMSQFMAINEGAFIQIVIWIGIAWTAFLLFVALSSIHQYSFGKTVGCILLTVFGMAVILFLIILFYSLLIQLVEFINSIIQEVSLRM